MRTCILLLIILFVITSCKEEEELIDINQLTKNVWFYEYPPMTAGKSETFVFNTDGTYTHSFEFYTLNSATGTSITKTEGSWTYLSDIQTLDLSDYGTCITPEGDNPCIPPDVDLLILRLTSEILQIDDVVNGIRPTPTLTTSYTYLE